MNKPPSTTSSHLKRRPAHLSVNLRHDLPPGSIATGKRKQIGSLQNKPLYIKANPASESSDESYNPGEPVGVNVENWFDRSNKCPGDGTQHTLDDGEPPYFLPHISSSNDSSESGSMNLDSSLVDSNNLAPNPFQSATHGSGSNDYRSVIDDLTVENKKLRERLRRYKSLYNPQFENDRLFEVKIHALPASKRRDLEEILRSFVSSVNRPADGILSNDASKVASPQYPAHLESGQPVPKNKSVSSTSNSQAVDSAYASMSASRPASTSISNPNLNGFEARIDAQPPLSKDQKIQSFLHDIPQGLLPKHSTVMTERQKKKLVVRRLEQLFTGKVNGNLGDHSQPLQQQEISKSAARADQVNKSSRTPAEGFREAHILTTPIGVRKAKPSDLSNKSSNETTTPRDSTGSTFSTTPNPLIPEQRPTRPLDLDPDRAQVPSDNMEYIRHLGQSTPQLVSEGSGDDRSDGQGWIYLNLLISMAQLHIINVTPDFVRSAVSDVSARFQLSPDGRKIRWRGGTEGTRLSRDNSDAGSGILSSDQDSDSLDEIPRKKRKLERSRMRMAARRHENPVSSADASTQAKSFHYKPLFHHRNSDSSMSCDDDISNMSYSPNEDSGVCRESRLAHLWGTRSGSGSFGKRRHEDGPIIFYSGAKFCTDLVGDRNDITTPLHTTNVGKDGYSNYTQNAIGCSSPAARHFTRTPSGSLLRSRPFKDYSRGPAFSQTERIRARTPELLSDDSMDMDMDFGIEWSSMGASDTTPLCEFKASGLGGTQPADHFALAVKTRRTKLDSATRAKSSKSTRGLHVRTFRHSIFEESLQFFRDFEQSDFATKFASLNAGSPPSSFPTSNEDVLVRTEVVSTCMYQLEPSELPEPLAYYSDSSSLEAYSDYGSSVCSPVRQGKSLQHGSHNSIPNKKPFFQQGQNFSSTDLITSGEEERYSDGTDDDTSIDMLAQARKLDPETVAAKEAEFEMEINNNILGEIPTGSSAATVDGGSGYSSLGPETRSGS